MHPLCVMYDNRVKRTSKIRRICEKGKKKWWTTKKKRSRKVSNEDKYLHIWKKVFIKMKIPRWIKNIACSSSFVLRLRLKQLTCLLILQLMCRQIQTVHFNTLQVYVNIPCNVKQYEFVVVFAKYLFLPLHLENRLISYERFINFDPLMNGI